MTRSVTFDVEFGGVEDSIVDGGRHAGFEAKGEIRRRDFGLGFPPPSSVTPSRSSSTCSSSSPVAPGTRSPLDSFTACPAWYVDGSRPAVRRMRGRRRPGQAGRPGPGSPRTAPGRSPRGICHGAGTTACTRRSSPCGRPGRRSDRRRGRPPPGPGSLRPGNRRGR
ncbi:YceI family protein [Streptosporangium roseum]|uniref:YceI family protein n=1 Tax=Streptosporangium roseum TaxID=2001 RepID=UPI003AFAA2A3